MFNNIYKGKKVFLTGHTGFKGSWLALWLTKLGAEVCGYSLEPNTTPSMFTELDIQNKIKKSIIGDILDYDKLAKEIQDFQPEIIFHLAAQPLVRLSYSEPILTYKTNVIGSLNVLEAARNCSSVYLSNELKLTINVTGSTKKNDIAKSSIDHVLLTAFCFILTKNEFFDVIARNLRFANKYFFQ